MLQTLAILLIGLNQQPTDDRQKIIDEINADCIKVADQLHKHDVGAATRAGQNRILENIDRLLKQQEPPDSKSPPPSNPPSPKSPPNPDPAPNPSDVKPQSNQQPKVVPKAQEAAPSGPRTLAELKAEMKADRWPGLPPRLRDEMDALGRDCFIRNYEELLRAYYRSLSESRRE